MKQRTSTFNERKDMMTGFRSTNFVAICDTLEDYGVLGNDYVPKSTF